STSTTTSADTDTSSGALWRDGSAHRSRGTCPTVEPTAATPHNRSGGRAPSRGEGKDERDPRHRGILSRAMRGLRTYFDSLAPRLPRDVYILEGGALVNAFGNGVVLPFLLIYLHNVRGIPFGLAGSAAAVQSAAALASGFLAGTLSDRLGPKRVLLGALVVMP